MGRTANEDEVVVKSGRGGSDEAVGLQANMSLFSAVMLGVNCIIGSGIFVSTKGVHVSECRVCSSSLHLRRIGWRLRRGQRGALAGRLAPVRRLLGLWRLLLRGAGHVHHQARRRLRLRLRRLRKVCRLHPSLDRMHHHPVSPIPSHPSHSGQLFPVDLNSFARILRPCTLAAVALIFATYVLNPFFPNCTSPLFTPQFLAAGCLGMFAAELGF